MTPGSGDRKLTRNLKRRYDEIHHVEKPVEDLNPIDQVWGGQEIRLVVALCV
jgi:hypothetical protein